jgi:hypothetical protein
VDFAIEDVLPRLQAWGLVQPGAAPGTYRAVPLCEARPLLMKVGALGAWRRHTLRTTEDTKANQSTNPTQHECTT